MREAGAPSTGRCARPTGDSHGRTTRGPAQRTAGQSKGRTKEAPQRGQENYKGRGPEGHRPGW